jgi:hypothetical protein
VPLGHILPSWILSSSSVSCWIFLRFFRFGTAAMPCWLLLPTDQHDIPPTLSSWNCCGWSFELCMLNVPSWIIHFLLRFIMNDIQFVGLALPYVPHYCLFLCLSYQLHPFAKFVRLTHFLPMRDKLYAVLLLPTLPSFVALGSLHRAVPV